MKVCPYVFARHFVIIDRKHWVLRILSMALLLNVVTFATCEEIWPRERITPFLRNYIAPLWPINYYADAMRVVHLELKPLLTVAELFIFSMFL